MRILKKKPTMFPSMKHAVRQSVAQLQELNYTKKDLCFGKYFKAVNKFGTVVLGCTFRLLYQIPETHNGKMSVRNYCLNEMNWSSTKYNKIFNSSERSVLQRPPASDEFVCDVSLLSKVILQVLGNRTDPIKKELRDLKNLRNYVCHEDLELNEDELDRRLEELQTLCRSILEGLLLLVPSNLQTDVHDVMKKVDGSLQDLVDAKLENSNIESYLEDLQVFREKKTSKMISEGRNELRANYSKLKILNPCPWLSDSHFVDFSVETTFTELTLQESGIPVALNDILNLSQLKERFVPQMVIVKGVMGSGKTSLFRYLLHQWCGRHSSVTGLSAVDIVIGIEMRTFSCGSLVQFLREQLLKNTCRLFSETDIIPVLQEMNVLFLIDGMDEAIHTGKAVVKEIINKFTESSVIVTTRPEFTLELMQAADEHVVLQVDGFGLESQRKFVEKVFAAKFSDDTRREREVQEFFAYRSNASVSLCSQLSLPLTLALLLVLWCDDSEKVMAVTTTSRLYHKIYEMSQQMLTSRLCSGGAGHTAAVSRKVKRWMLELGREAWNMMLKESLCLTQKSSSFLMDLCEKEKIDPITTLSTFLNSETKETLAGTVYSFSFQHSSSQEYLAALYVSEEACESGSVFPLMKGINSPRFQEVIMYTAGLLKLNQNLTENHASEIQQLMRECVGTHIGDPRVWCRLMQETEKDPSMCKVIGAFINQGWMWVINSWDREDMTKAKLTLLKETKAAPAQIVINIQFTTRLEECPQIVDIIRLLGEESKSQVKLFADHLFHTPGVYEHIDASMVPLLNANNLVEFRGHAGIAFTTELVKGTRLQSLCVKITSLEALAELCASIRKHRDFKVRIMPSRKWSLQNLEIFLDISHDTPPSDIPVLAYRKVLVLILSGVRDERAKWAGSVVQRFSTRYDSVTLMSASLSLVGLKKFLKAAQDTTIKVLRVLSDHPTPYSDVTELSVKRGMKLEWGGI